MRLGSKELVHRIKCMERNHEMVAFGDIGFSGSVKKCQVYDGFSCLSDVLY